MTLSEEIQTIVHAFDDTGRRNAIRDLAKRVAQREAELDTLEKEVDFLADAYQDVGKLLWEALDERDDLRARHLKSDSLREENWKEVLRLQAQLRHCVMGHEATTEKLESVRAKLAAAEARVAELEGALWEAQDSLSPTCTSSMPGKMKDAP